MAVAWRQQRPFLRTNPYNLCVRVCISVKSHVCIKLLCVQVAVLYLAFNLKVPVLLLLLVLVRKK